jgi:hypothetical protein
MAGEITILHLKLYCRAIVIKQTNKQTNNQKKKTKTKLHGIGTVTGR